MTGNRQFPPTVTGHYEEHGELILETIDPAVETDIPTGKPPRLALVGK